MRGYTAKLSFISIITVFLIILNLLLPARSCEGAIDGLILCANVIIPSLFPFCVIALFCFKSGVTRFISKILSPIAQTIFHISGEQLCVFIMSFLAGYPVGMRLINELESDKRISNAQAKRMGIYCVNAGPAFILAAVGEGILGDKRIGTILLLSNIIATVLLAFVVEFRSRPAEKNSEIAPMLSISDAFVESTAQAARSIFGICAWITLFSALLAILNSGIIPKFIYNIFSYIGEVTTGVISVKGNVPLAAAIISWGGLSVHCQVYSVGKQNSPKYLIFLAGRAFHAAVSSLLTYSFLKLDNRAISVISNGVTVTRHNVSFTYASAAALIIMCVFLLISINEQKRDKLL